MATRYPQSCRLTLTELETRETPATNFLAFGAAAGGTPLVEVLRPDGTSLARFEAFDSAFRGGVRAVAAELDGDPNTVEVIAGAGPGGSPHVTIWSVDVDSGTVVPRASFFAFNADFRGGVRVAAGQVAGLGDREQIVLGAEVGGGPRVRVLELNGGTVSPIASPLGDFFAFEPDFRGGARVAAGELDGNRLNGDELVVAAGPGGGPRVRTFTSNGALVSDVFAFAPDFGGGVNVAVETSGVIGRLRVDADPADFSQRNAALNQAAAGAALQAAVAGGSNAVFSALFANPSFTTALNDAGLGGTEFFNNGVFDVGAFNTAGNRVLFDTAFTRVFGTAALENAAFAGAFNSVTAFQNALLAATTTTGTTFGNLTVVSGAVTGPFASTGFATSVPLGTGIPTPTFTQGMTPFVATSTPITAGVTFSSPITAPVTFTSVSSSGSPSSATTFGAGAAATTPILGAF